MYPGLYPFSPCPSAGSDVWSPPIYCSALLIAVCGGCAGLSLLGPLYFPLPSACVQVFPTFMRLRRLFLFIAPVPVSSVCATCVLRCSSCWVWGATLAHCLRYWQDRQVKSGLRHLHHAVLHVNVGLYSQQVSTAGRADRAGSVV